MVREDLPADAGGGIGDQLRCRDRDQDHDPPPRHLRRHRRHRRVRGAAVWTSRGPRGPLTLLLTCLFATTRAAIVVDVVLVVRRDGRGAGNLLPAHGALDFLFGRGRLFDRGHARRTTPPPEGAV